MVLLDEAGLGRSAARIVAAGHLTNVIEHFWIHDGAHPRDRWRVVPDCSGYLIFSASRHGGGVETQLFVVGARSRYADVDTTGRCLTIAARIRPGALALLTGAPAPELTDRAIPLADLMGPRAGELIERMSTTTPADAQRHMATFIARQFDDADLDSLRLGRLLKRTATVATFASTLGLGTRSVYERCRESVGLAPKRALRIARLHRALSLASGCQSWSEVAATAGYADQAHLTRDMQTLLGEGPTNWARRGRLADSFKTGFAKTR